MGKKENKKYSKQNTTENLLRVRVFLTIIVLLTVLVFAHTLKGDFLDWDDADVVVHNELVKNFDGAAAFEFLTQIYSNDYRPLTYISYGLIHTAWGMNPKAFHFFCLLFHVLNVILVFFLAKKLSSNEKTGLLTALLFALHPMLVESIAWISALNDVMFTSFLLTGLLLYTNYINNKLRITNLIYCFLLFMLAVLTKPLAIVFPALLFLFDFYFNRKLSKKSIAEKIPFFIVSAIFIIITFVSREQEVLSSLNAYTFLDRFFFVFYALAFYLVKFVFPFGLSSLHDFPAKIDNLLPLVYYLSPLLTIFLAVLIYNLKKHRRLLVFGLLFFLINVSLVIQIIPFGKFIVAERYSYMAYIGLFFIMASFISKYILLPGHLSSFMRKLSQAFFVLVIVFYGFTSFNRAKVWRSTISLWESVLQNNPDVAIAYNQIGLHFFFNNQYDKAIQNFNTAIEKNKDFSVAYNNRGNLYLNINETDKALSDFEKAISLNPQLPDPYYNIGTLKGNIGQSSEAIKYYTLAIKNNPKYANAFYNRAYEYARSNDHINAVNDYSAYIDIIITDAEAFYNRGLAFMKIENFENAIEDFDKSLALKSDNAPAYYNKAISSLSINKFHQACLDLQIAINLGYSPAVELFNSNCP